MFGLLINANQYWSVLSRKKLLNSKIRDNNKDIKLNEYYCMNINEYSISCQSDAFLQSDLELYKAICGNITRLKILEINMLNSSFAIESISLCKEWTQLTFNCYSFDYTLPENFLQYFPNLRSISLIIKLILTKWYSKTYPKWSLLKKSLLNFHILTLILCSKRCLVL